MTPTPPPSRYIPARPEWLEGWCGPVEWLDFSRSDYGKWIRSAYGAGGMANGAPVDRIRLDPSRPEVRDLLCRRLSLPDSHRIGEWATALCWWAAHTGRTVRYVLTAVLAHDCALLTSDGAILLPPLVAGGPPILWSPDAR